MQTAFKMCLRNIKAVAKHQAKQAATLVQKTLCGLFKTEVKEIMVKYREATTALFLAECKLEKFKTGIHMKESLQASQRGLLGIDDHY